MCKNEQRLIDSGWWKTADKLWLNPDMNQKFGGHTLSFALEEQDRDIIAKYGAFYYVQRDNFGFGYWIGVYKNNVNSPKRTDFNHLTKETATIIVDNLNKGINQNPESYIKDEFNLITIFHEKHGDRHFLVHTRGDLEKVALKIVLERNKEKWYYFDYKEPKSPKIALSDANSLGENLEQAVKQEWETYDYSLKQYKESLELKEMLSKIVKDKDSKLALTFLSEMRHGEYEGFEVIQPEKY